MTDQELTGNRLELDLATTGVPKKKSRWYLDSLRLVDDFLSHYVFRDNQYLKTSKMLFKGNSRSRIDSSGYTTKPMCKRRDRL